MWRVCRSRRGRQGRNWVHVGFHQRVLAWPRIYDGGRGDDGSYLLYLDEDVHLQRLRTRYRVAGVVDFRLRDVGCGMVENKSAA